MGFSFFILEKRVSGGTNLQHSSRSRSRSRSRQDDFTTGWEKERKKERKSVFEAVGLLTTTNPSMLRLLVWYFGRGDDDGGGGDGGGGDDDDYGLAKVVQLYIPCLWWCLHDLTNPSAEITFFPTTTISI
jgi:hypothetical protein